MAIKDQCLRCKLFDEYTSICKKDYSNAVFNGSSCENWQSKGTINLDKNNINSSAKSDVSISRTEESAITSAYLMANTEIKGWLSFFLVTRIIGGLVSLIYPICTFNVADCDGSYIVAFGDILLGAMYLALAIYTVYAFSQRKSDAVFLAKTLVVISFVSQLLVLVGGEFESSGFGSLQNTISSLIWGVIWFLYLCFSKQVNRVIPKEFRKRTHKDWLIIAALIVIPMIWFIAVIIDYALMEM